MNGAQQGIVEAGLFPRLHAGITKQCERFMSIPSEIAIRGMNLPFRNRHPTLIENRRQVTDRTNEAVDLAPADQAIVDAVAMDGICVTSLDDLAVSGAGGMFEQASTVANVLMARADHALSRGKHTLVSTADDLLKWNRILRWGLESRLLDIAEAYLGAPAAYDGSLLYQSKADGREESVRNWHRDREDVRMLKIGIYLNDVDEDGGPFQVMTPELQEKIDRRAGWRYAVMKNAQLTTKIRATDWDTGVRTVNGARGTVFFVDTARCHHRGKPPTAQDRNALFYTYFTRNPRHPFCCERSPLSRRQIAAFAATLPERERACVLWRQNLPLLQRLIPRNRLTI